MITIISSLVVKYDISWITTFWGFYVQSGSNVSRLSNVQIRLQLMKYKSSLSYVL